MICAGIDAGSHSTKVVLFEPAAGRVLGRGLANQAMEWERLAAAVLDGACRQAQVERASLGPIVATGYGRKAVRFATTTITEITCHAQGVYHLAPEARTIIEIGGQDSKYISLEEGGRVRDFAMNDRCAAGSGRFLELVAARLELDLLALGALSLKSTKPAPISSMCAVFAETEIIGLLSEGVPAPDIAAGVQNAIAQRVLALAGRSVPPPVFFTGGVALQPGMVRALATAFSCVIQVPPQPQFTGALGAAILAGRQENYRS